MHTFSYKLKGQCPEILKLHSLKDNLLIQRFTSIFVDSHTTQPQFGAEYWCTF